MTELGKFYFDSKKLIIFGTISLLIKLTLALEC
jgi:hypothetical protein